MSGGSNKTPRELGFTIIEVMMFLAISGLTFLIAINFISGKQNQVQYEQGTRNANINIQSLINDVVNGNYPFPASANTYCSVANGYPAPPLNPNTTPDCTFVGKVIAPESGATTPANPYSYDVFTVVGCQFYSGSKCATDGSIPTDYSQEVPTVFPQFNQTTQWPGSLEIKKLLWVQASNPGTPNAIGEFGIYSTPPNNNGSSYVNGEQPVSIVAFSGTSLRESQSNLMSDVTNPAGTVLSQNDYIVMCFMGPNNKKSSISIGSGSGGNQVISTLDNNVDQEGRNSPCNLN